MAARVLTLRTAPGPRPRPRGRLVPVPVSPSVLASLSSSPSSAVRVGWDEWRGLHVAVCDHCAESFASALPGDVDDWTDAHHCDAERAELLAEVCESRRAA
ncbi:hypothetical protein ACFHW2_14390 [Actinomadura sp. LOL_016]|uniref:hypothetical protein n=1 Tax=unclassified Actinomadura TaxID=2626254 RepID=UPI003A80D76E